MAAPLDANDAFTGTCQGPRLRQPHPPTLILRDMRNMGVEARMVVVSKVSTW